MKSFGLITKQYDINLLDDETPDDVCVMLAQRFGVQADYSDEQASPACTIDVLGTPDEHRRVAAWHNAPHTPRPDLRGKPPVSKGERRTP